MSQKAGKQQKYYIQYCERVINILKRINTIEDEKRKIYIAKNAELLRSLGSVFENISKMFGDVNDNSIIYSIYHESVGSAWTDNCNLDKACEYMENLAKVAENIVKIGKQAHQKKCLCCEDSVYFVPSSPQFFTIRGIKYAINLSKQAKKTKLFKPRHVKRTTLKKLAFRGYVCANFVSLCGYC